jgi:Cys-tRNA(Pro) deacylase
MEKHAVQAELVKLPVHTLTVEAAAQAVGTSPDQIVKSLLFIIDGAPVLAIACGTGHVDRRSIAGHFGVGRKRVKLADGETVLDVTGYPVGAVPPFGQRQDLRTLVDHKVLDHEVVYAGGGAIDTLLRVAPTEIVRLTDPVELDLLRPPSEGS